MKTLGRWGAQILAAVLVLSATALAGDPPGRVARLQYMSGEVSVQPGGVNDWVPGVINRPLTTADRVWTDKNARAELNLGTAALRANAETSLTLTNVSDGTAQVELDQGTLNLRVRHLYHGEIYEIDTPNVAFTVMKSGEYRIDVDPRGDTTLITVWQGQGEATGLGRAVKIRHGQTAGFTGGASLTHQIYEARGFDGFDDWCRVRDKRQDYSQSLRYAPGVIGVEDLDDYGTWRVVPAYGTVWVPAVAPGWAPYHYGHWAWIEPWGWTWIDDAPWGFAPCHYGRWVYYSNYWAWAPGPVVVRPVYAPALVAWVGGSNWGVSLALGGGPAVGWFPLGYGEPYIPPYGASRNYFRNVNVTNTRITNITNITNNYYNTANINKTINNNSTIVTTNNTNITKNNTTNITDNSININGNHNHVRIDYANQKVPGAVTAVPSTVLTNSESVAKLAVKVPERDLKNTLVASAPPVSPSRTSILGPRAGEHSATPPAESESRKVVAKLPAPPKPVPFAAKEQPLSTHAGRPLDSKTQDALRTNTQREPAGLAASENQPQSDAKAGETRFANRPAVLNPETPARAATTPVSVVPHPTEKIPASPGAQEENAAAHPQIRQAGNAETPRSELRIVPRPPEKMQVEQPAAASTDKASKSSENRPAANAPDERFQNHLVPRPPIAKPAGRGTEPVITTPRAQPRLVPQPPANQSGSQASTNAGGTERALPRRDPVQARPAQPPASSQQVVPGPPQRATATRATYEPVASSPPAQPRVVPQPATTNPALPGNMPRRDPVQVHPPQSQSNSPRQVSGPPRSPFTPPPAAAARQPESSARTMYQPGATSSVPQAARASNGGGGVRSQAPNAPAAQAQPSRSAPSTEQRH
jgi:hypothetical protein